MLSYGKSSERIFSQEINSLYFSKIRRLTMKELNNKKVVLLEGTRKVFKADGEYLILFAKTLAAKYPNMIFRSGNADGSDELFAKGIESIDAKRIEQILPYPNSHKKRLHEDSRILSLDELTKKEIGALADFSLKATPNYKALIEAYMKTMNKNRLTVKAIYLLRDALKVTGLKRLDFKPAEIGIFYTNDNKPTGGGTGHTIRMCKLHNIPIITQKTWLKLITN